MPSDGGGNTDGVDLYLTDNGPQSDRICRRLRELGIDCELRTIPGPTRGPVLVADDGMAYRGEDAIIEYLDWFEPRSTP